MMIHIGKHGVSFNRYAIFFFGTPATWRLSRLVAQLWLLKKDHWYLPRLGTRTGWGRILEARSKYDIKL